MCGQLLPILFSLGFYFTFEGKTPNAPFHLGYIDTEEMIILSLSIFLLVEKAEERHCEILGHLLYTAKVVAKQECLEKGFRIVINDGPDGCMSYMSTYFSVFSSHIATVVLPLLHSSRFFFRPICLSSSYSSSWRTTNELATRLT